MCVDDLQLGFRLWTVEAGDDSFHGYCLPVLDLKQEKEKKKKLMRHFDVTVSNYFVRSLLFCFLVT